jgi:hypothetical protein
MRNKRHKHQHIVYTGQNMREGHTNELKITNKHRGIDEIKVKEEENTARREYYMFS